MFGNIVALIIAQLTIILLFQYTVMTVLVIKTKRSDFNYLSLIPFYVFVSYFLDDNFWDYAKRKYSQYDVIGFVQHCVRIYSSKRSVFDNYFDNDELKREFKIFASKK